MTDVRTVMDAVSDNPKATYTKGDVKTILNQISGTASGTIEVDRLRRGDVFSATLVGGKRRPWLTLSNRRGVVVAVAMSSAEHGPEFRESKCRYWPGSWIGGTVSTFNDHYARKEFMRTYSNHKHLAEVERDLAQTLGLARAARPRRRKASGNVVKIGARA